GRDDQKDDPDGRVHAPGLRVAVHPQRAEDEGHNADQTDSEGEYEPLGPHDLERARHRFAGGTALTLFHHCSMPLGSRLTPSRTIVSPIARSRNPSTRSATPPRARPPSEVRTSPTWRPAASAGDPDETSARNTPWRLVMP